VVPLHAIDVFDLAGRDLIGEHHRKGSVAGRTHSTKPASALIIPTPPAAQRGTAARPYGARHPIIGRRRRKRGRTKAADLRYRIEPESRENSGRAFPKMNTI